jgi:hypothetical protein
MRTTSVLIALAATIGLLNAAPSLWAMPAPAAMCCQDHGDCPDHAGVCCVPDELPCADEQPGYCVQQCVPPGR